MENKLRHTYISSIPLKEYKVATRGCNVFTAVEAMSNCTVYDIAAINYPTDTIMNN
jgi:hypothetical protein